MKTDDVAQAAGRAGLSLPPAMLESLSDPLALLRRRTVKGGWADLPRLLTAASRDLTRHQRFADRALAAIDDAEAALLATARDRATR
jgi:hypothetical protein